MVITQAFAFAGEADLSEKMVTAIIVIEMEIAEMDGDWMSDGDPIAAVHWESEADCTGQMKLTQQVMPKAMGKEKSGDSWH